MSVQLEEAAKRLAAAKEAYGHAVTALDRQYLKPLVAAGDPKVLKAVTDIRASYADVAEAVEDVAGKAVGHTQPEAAVAPSRTRKK